MTYKLVIIFYLFCFSLVFSADLTGIPHDINSSNHALLFTMTDESGRTRNLQLMEESFEDKKFGFICNKFHNVSSVEIYNKIKEQDAKI